MNFKRIPLIGLLLIAGSIFPVPQAVADSIVELGMHVGGDEVIYEAATNGKRNSIKAGELFSFAFGKLHPLAASLDYQLTFGIKSDAKYSNDVKISWVRYPFNMFLFYRMNGMRIGMGATYHISPQLRGEGLASNIGEKYDNALGGLLGMEFNINEKFLWAIRLTAIDYQSRRDGHVVNGNSIGLLIIGQL